MDELGAAAAPLTAAGPVGSPGAATGLSLSDGTVTAGALLAAAIGAAGEEVPASEVEVSARLDVEVESEVDSSRMALSATDVLL